MLTEIQKQIRDRGLTLLVSQWFEKRLPKAVSPTLNQAEHILDWIAGHNGKVKGKIGCWFALTEWKRDDKDGIWRPLCVKAAQIDGKKIKEDIWYQLKDGEFIEVK